jgi:very-short-patch-repair endonuclease
MRKRSGIRIHRKALAERDITRHKAIPVTSPIRTIVDLATRLPDGPLERCINEADQRRLATPVQIRAALDHFGNRRGVARLRKLLDIRTFRFTRSDLERVFIPLATRVGLPIPLTRVWLDGFEVDFYWPDLDLVVETDGLTYHRTPQQQAEDLLRDQAHKAAGRECLRFSHGQIRFTPRHVEAVLARVGARLGAAASS